MRVVITGATSGLGAELARQYAANGATHLGLVGRREALLAEVAEACRSSGAQVQTYTQDVTDGKAMVELAEDFVGWAGGADLVIANAGVGAPDNLGSGDPSALTWMMDVNVNGVINTLVPFVKSMQAAEPVRGRRGHLVAIASLAGFRALPHHGGYAASKIAVRTLMDGFSYALEHKGISATTINPGFVVSEMTAKNEFPMPFMLQTDVAVRRMRRAIARRNRTYSFPRRLYFLIWLLQRLPRFIVSRVRG
ncbi:MAG: SDR family NAD(P)-dependent oxidoreductase [Planctomycetes bacterium]|nr:SDR family NAD(P)-dependent oxidoreductase [Planctomycetota bacterium]